MKGGEIPAKLTQKTTDFRKFKIRAYRCCAAVQEKSHNQDLSLWLEELQNSKHSEEDVVDSLIFAKISSVQSSQLLLQVSA